MDRIEEIRAAAEDYGRRSVENMRMGEKLGREIMAAFDRYLSPSGGLVIGVPPRGDWQPDKGDYHDAAFSYYHTPVLTVRDTQFGMSVRIFDHYWVRLVVNLKKEGERIAVLIDNGDPIWISVNYNADDLTSICERLFQSLIGLYRGDVNVFVHGDERLMTIGFLASHS
jgi:hypothetical protein